ncbi:tetratricopeptide repeat protein [Flavobacterium sp. NST-5]|uniref:Tetratricopeptide repeat protein n=1 Tax=Flavobacterium ichthyis TaxID=2698827 RepID=A0ABW9Z985_9FLAO|nr:tetratricopeptide repeat-containing sensor histidine kinase [Flavobacterium ichthyis]NBL64354.1 tetratricopeptide repeat protein [Flavobacterium ichthyis]
MKRLFFFLFLLNNFAVNSQQLDDNYINQKLEEASKLNRQFEYDQSFAVLDNLYNKALQENNQLVAGIALIKKTAYQIVLDENFANNIDWKTIEKLQPETEPEKNIFNAKLLLLKSGLAQKQDNLSQAFQYLDQALQTSGKIKDNADILGEIYLLYGQLKAKESEYVEANSYFLNALQLAKKIGDKNSEGTIYGELANTSFLMGEKSRAKEYAKQGIEILKEFDNREELIIQLSNLGRIYQLEGDFESAIPYFSESAELASKSKSKETIFVSLVDLALVYHAKKDRPNALKFMQQAITEGKKMNRPKLYRYIRMGAMFAGYVGDEALMNQLYEESFILAKQAKDKDALRDWNGSQSFYYANVKNDKAKAFPFLEKFHAYKDSILNEKSRKDFNELEIKYQSEKKQAEIERLARNEKIQELEIERKNALLRGNLLEANEKQKEIELLTTQNTLAQLKVEQQRKTISLREAQVLNFVQEKKIAKQQVLLNQAKLKNEKLNRNLAILLFVISGIIFAFLYNRMLLRKKLEQKKILLSERSRIASELHDEVGSTLTAINLMSYSTANKISEPESKIQLHKISENTQSVMESISDIVWSMNPDNDTFDKMIIRMKEFAVNVLEPQNVDFQFQIENGLETVKFSPEKRRDFYLIFKEAMNNLAKYAQASLVKISIKKSNKNIIFKIVDNGKGFNVNQKNSGNGLKNMKHRAEKHNGKFLITSSFGRTEINLHFPHA